MHAKTNHTLARVSNDISSPARVSDDISEPIRLWHVPPIRLRHMSLTHLQTPINRSLPKAFNRHQDILGERPRDREEILSSEVQKLCWNQALKPLGTSRTSTSNTKNIWREIIQIIFLDLKGHWNQAQKPPDTPKNYKLVKFYGFKPPKPWRTFATNLQIRRTFEEESYKSYS